jgi:hypothetical protein
MRAEPLIRRSRESGNPRSAEDVGPVGGSRRILLRWRCGGQGGFGTGGAHTRVRRTGMVQSWRSAALRTNHGSHQSGDARLRRIPWIYLPADAHPRHRTPGSYADARELQQHRGRIHELRHTETLFDVGQEPVPQRSSRPAAGRDVPRRCRTARGGRDRDKGVALSSRLARP